MPLNISWPGLKGPSKLNAYHILIFSFLVLTVGFKCFLKLKQIFFLYNVKFPAEFAKRKLDKEAHWQDSIKAQLITESIDFLYELVDGCFDISIVYFGILPWLWQVSSRILFARQVADKSRPIRAEILQSIVFGMVIAGLGHLIKLPFILASAIARGSDPTLTFVALLFGLVGTVYAAFISTAITGVIVVNLWHRFPSYLFGMRLGFSLLAIVLFDVVSFWSVSTNSPGNYKSLGTNAFGTKVSALANKFGFPVERIFISDSGSEINAHYSGVIAPLTKHIVVFQGLIEKFTLPAAVSVMGHEFGHWYLMHVYQHAAMVLLLFIATTVVFYCLAFKPGTYTALGFEPPRPQTQEEGLQSPAQPPIPGAPPRKSTSKFKTWLMPYYIVSTVLTYYIRPLTFLDISIIALAHRNEFQADRFSATHTSKKDAIDMLYQLHEHAAPRHYTGVGDPFVDFCTRTHPHTVNRAKAIEEL